MVVYHIETNKIKGERRRNAQAVILYNPKHATMCGKFIYK